MGVNFALARVSPYIEKVFIPESHPWVPKYRPDEKKVKQLEEIAESKLKDQIAKRQVLAEAKIDQLTRDANNQIQLHISSTAIEAMVNLLKEKLDDKEKQKIIDSSINELSSVLKN